MRRVVLFPVPGEPHLALSLVAPHRPDIPGLQQRQRGELGLHVGHGWVFLQTPQSLRRGAKHAVAHQGDAQLGVNLRCREGRHEGGVAEGVVLQVGVIHHVGFHVLEILRATCQRALNLEDIAFQQVLHIAVHNLPTQHHGAHAVHVGPQQAGMVNQRQLVNGLRHVAVELRGPRAFRQL